MSTRNSSDIIYGDTSAQSRRLKGLREKVVVQLAVVGSCFVMALIMLILLSEQYYRVCFVFFLIVLMYCAVIFLSRKKGECMNCMQKDDLQQLGLAIMQPQGNNDTPNNNDVRLRCQDNDIMDSMRDIDDTSITYGRMSNATSDTTNQQNPNNTSTNIRNEAHISSYRTTTNDISSNRTRTITNDFPSNRTRTTTNDNPSNRPRTTTNDIQSNRTRTTTNDIPSNRTTTTTNDIPSNRTTTTTNDIPGNRTTTNYDPPPYEDMRTRFTSQSQMILNDIIPMSGHTAVHQTNDTNNVIYDTNAVNIIGLPQYTASYQSPSYNETESDNERETSLAIHISESGTRIPRTPPPSYNDVMDDILYRLYL